MEESYLDIMPIPKPDVRYGIGACQMDVNLVSSAQMVQSLAKRLAFVTGGSRLTAAIHRDFTATTMNFIEMWMETRFNNSYILINSWLCTLINFLYIIFREHNAIQGTIHILRNMYTAYWIPSLPMQESNKDVCFIYRC